MMTNLVNVEDPAATEEMVQHVNMSLQLNGMVTSVITSLKKSMLEIKILDSETTPIVAIHDAGRTTLEAYLI